MQSRLKVIAKVLVSVLFSFSKDFYFIWLTNPKGKKSKQKLTTGVRSRHRAEQHNIITNLGVTGACVARTVGGALYSLELEKEFLQVDSYFLFLVF